jgi:hypothetical protein
MSLALIALDASGSLSYPLCQKIANNKDESVVIGRVSARLIETDADRWWRSGMSCQGREILAPPALALLSLYQ